MKDERNWHEVAFQWLVFHSAAGFVILSLVALRLGILPWEAGRKDVFVAGLLVAGYASGAIVTHIVRWIRGDAHVVEVLVAAVAGYAPVFAALVLVDVQFSFLLPVAGLTASVVFLAVIFSLPEYRTMAIAAALVAAFAGWGVLGARTAVRDGAGTQGDVDSVRINSSLYALEATFYRKPFPENYTGWASGAITQLEDQYLVVTGAGDLYAFRFSSAPDRRIKVTPKGDVPLNRGSFTSVTGETNYNHFFRVLDLYARKKDERTRLYASYHHWKPEQECFLVRLSAVDLPSDGTVPRLTDSDWKTIHETEPCLPLKTDTDPNWPFRGMEGGGRIAPLDSNHLLMTVGDHGFNGYRYEPDYVQDTTSSYGKTVAVDLSDGDWEPYTIGHRNPQGLWVDTSGVAWLTEHGPRGGDELNRLVEGENYGWPVVTNGTDYGKHAWPLNDDQGRHDGFRRPVLAWVPAIGPSNLLRVDGSLFGAWQGDLLVTSLKSETIYRTRIREGKVVLTEPIDIGERIRDIIQDESGRIVLWTDSYSIVVLEPTTMAFARCSGCHNIGDGTDHALGPDLAGIPGREIASAEGYDYSEALRELDGRWTEERLRRFLRDPQAVAPGTSMRMSGIDDPDLRDTIVDYLVSESR